MRANKLTAAVFGGLLVVASGAAAHDGNKLIFGSVTTLAVGSQDANDANNGGRNAWEWSSTSSYNIPIWRGWALQLDSVSEYYKDSNVGSDPRHLNAGGAHLSYRVPNMGLIGVFGAYGASEDRNNVDGAMSLFGVEGQYYWGNWTFYAQAGGGNQNETDQGEGFNSGKFGRGVVRYFMTPNTKLEGELSYATAKDYVDGNDGKLMAWGASIDHKLGSVFNMPVYGTLAYRGSTYKADNDPDHFEEHVFKVGVKVMFGAKDLKQNDRYGATLDLPTMPFRAHANRNNLE
jgi:hypothetical protein